MAIAADKVQNVPMSVRMRQVLAAVRRMPTADRLQILVKAGLMTETEAHQAVSRLAPVQRPRRKPKARQAVSAKKGTKPPKP